jgi:hypothetical protein
MGAADGQDPKLLKAAPKAAFSGLRTGEDGASVARVRTTGGPPMALSTRTMTDEQRRSVACEYLKAFDNAGVTSGGVKASGYGRSGGKAAVPE